MIRTHLGVGENNLLVFEGNEATVEDFRHWVNSTMEILKGSSEYAGLVWDAHKLSWECQAVLLKPLEEILDSCFVLVADNENALAETILSRCSVERVGGALQNDNEDYWQKVLECWKNGPGACVEYSEKLSQEEALRLAEEVIEKVKNMMEKEVNIKRVEILKKALLLYEEMKARNLNVKLCLGEFLLEGWRAVK